MQKKAQLLSQPFTYIFAIIVIGLIFLFGFQMIGKLKSTSCSVENAKFITDINNEIQRISSVGFSGSNELCALVPRSRASDAPCEIIMPSGVQGVCILDPARIETNKIPFEDFSKDMRLLEGRTQNNLYFIPEKQGCKIEATSPIKLENVEIKNTICAKPGEITKIIIENKGRTVEIRKAS